MSRYFSEKFDSLVPYVPGEQPKKMRCIKLNTNESPFPPSPLAVELAAKAAENFQLYSDPECRELVSVACDCFGVGKDEILFTNGSDEILNFAFMAFCDAKHPAVFPDITYGFYPVFAELNGVPYETIPLAEDFSLRVEDYVGIHKTIFIANPNAPTGLTISLADIERIVASNPDNVVVIDEAYVDFGGESAVQLIHKYDNLLITQTFSKSRSMAGARLGFGIGCKELIRDLNTIKYSTNPYNINSATMAAGVGALKDADYFQRNCAAIVKTREWTTGQLRELGFRVLDSKANFVFAAAPDYPGQALYLDLKARGILVRHFETPRLKDFNRITIGSPEQMAALIAAIKELLQQQP
ncbi:MAG: histidinol-phosphate transaminase [Faecousia sp.]